MTLTAAQIPRLPGPGPLRECCCDGDVWTLPGVPGAPGRPASLGSMGQSAWRVSRRGRGACVLCGDPGGAGTWGPERAQHRLRGLPCGRGTRPGSGVLAASAETVGVRGAGCSVFMQMPRERQSGSPCAVAPGNGGEAGWRKGGSALPITHVVSSSSAFWDSVLHRRRLQAVPPWPFSWEEAPRKEEQEGNAFFKCSDVT